VRNDIDFNYFKKCLEERLEAIMARQVAQKEDEAPIKLDQSKVGRLTRMDAMQQQAMSQASGRLAEQERQRIVSALNRIKSGDYGYCIKCKDEITEGRLKFDPSVLVCIACAKDAERR
jgi:DnaK suppressor protein